MCNPVYCDKIEKYEKVLDLATNGGVTHSGLKCEVEKLREAWFNTNFLENISSFADLVDRFRIEYDSKIEDAFWVYMGNKKMKFNRLENRIYEMCTGTTNDKQKQPFTMQLINNVDKNKTFLTKRQQVEAKRARELFNLVGCRSDEDTKLAIRMNLIKKNLVTNEAVQWATKIYGMDIVQLKAQTTRRLPNLVVGTSIDISD